MSSKNVESVRAAHESWNRRDFEGVLRDMADNLVYNDTTRHMKLNGKQQFREWCQAWATAFPDGRIKDVRYTDAGDTVIAEMNFEGTNKGNFAGLPPTGRRVTMVFCEITRFDNNGRIASGNGYYDLYSILTQLGHVQPLAVAA
ncbi:MAG TPA: ester cyclase [Terriglobales bacterium]|nr:ester cyclase [Terriglobales bacterium]